MNHLSERDIRERINILIESTNGVTDITNTQLLLMVYIQLSCKFDDIDTNIAKSMIDEYILKREKTL